MDDEHGHARKEGTGERKRAGVAAPPLSQEWQEWGGSLLVVWDHARRAEQEESRRRRRQSDCDPALAAMMEAARPDWPLDDRVRFVHAQLVAFRGLAEDVHVRAEIVRRGLHDEALGAVMRALREIASEVDLPGSLAAPQAVVAGLVGRYGGAHRRAAYVLDAVLGPDEDSDDRGETVHWEPATAAAVASQVGGDIIARVRASVAQLGANVASKLAPASPRG